MAKRSQRNVRSLWCILTILYTKIIPTIFPLQEMGQGYGTVPDATDLREGGQYDRSQHKIETLLKDYGIHCPVSVIPSGIDLSKYDAQTRTDFRERIRRKYKMDRKTTVLLYVGRLAKEKNVEELLEYQQKIQESGTILMIVGGGPYLETLRKRQQNWV